MDTMTVNNYNKLLFIISLIIVSMTLTTKYIKDIDYFGGQSVIRLMLY